VDEGTLIQELALVGPAGEPVDLRRLLSSHGVASLPPMRLETASWTLEATLPLGRGARTVRVSAGRPGFMSVRCIGPRLAPAPGRELLQRLRHVLSLDVDLSPFYRLARADPELSWACLGAGRMIRSATVFEDVIKTLCTTNCSWSGTVRMVSALVEHLGVRAPGAPPSGPLGRAFPTPEAMAAAPDAFYRQVVGAGYRAPFLRGIATAVAEGRLDLEGLADPGLSDAEVGARLLALPGIGPYATAHVGLMLGRTSTLILDSWTRPTYARLRRRKVSDRALERRFARYGRYAGLAFWLVLTRDWVEETVAAGTEAEANRA
jgi:3-methyladenine DNA glycosylase/8-oxoguanine DNA glycosylase